MTHVENSGEDSRGCMVGPPVSGSFSVGKYDGAKKGEEAGSLDGIEDGHGSHS